MKIKINWPNTIAAIGIVLMLLVFPFVNPCQSEDGLACTWSAQEQGNGIGINFTDFYGVTLFHP